MAKVKYNVVTHSVSGRIGDLLEFRQRYGKTIISKIAERNDKVTPKQEQARARFRRAASYGKRAVKDPLKKVIYEKNASGDMRPYVLAFKDYLTSPVVQDFNIEDYTGAIGSTIEVNVTDDTKVTAVHVSIFKSNGDLLEEGEALQEPDTDTWIYTATVTNGSLTNCRIVAKARDMPGNKTTGEIVL